MSDFVVVTAKDYTEEELQTMQDLEQAQFDKMLEFGKEERDAEIVRCKDCVHYDGRPCGFVNWYNGREDFCSRAKERGDQK